MKKITTLLLVAMLMSGCMTERKQNRLKKLLCNEFSTTIVKDSIIKIPIYYEDSAAMQLYLWCDSLGNIHQSEKTTLQGKISALEARLTDNKVYIRSTTKVTDTVLKTVTNTKTIQGANIVTEKPKTWWQKTCGIGFPICIALFVLWLIWRLWLKKKFSFTINPFM